MQKPNSLPSLFRLLYRLLFFCLFLNIRVCSVPDPLLVLFIHGPEITQLSIMHLGKLRQSGGSTVQILCGGNVVGQA